MIGKHTVYFQVQKEQNTICWCQKSILEIQEYNFFAGYHSLIAQQAMEAQKKSCRITIITNVTTHRSKKLADARSDHMSAIAL
jgi:hypothetical protein